MDGLSILVQNVSNRMWHALNLESMLNCTSRCFRQMIATAWEWARTRGLIRTNPIHGEEEAKLVLTEVFEVNSETGNETSMTGTIEAEDST